MAPVSLDNPSDPKRHPPLEVNPALAALQVFFGQQDSRVASAGQQVVLPVAVAYSGGADSTALLLAAAQCWPGQVMALHVHHGLQTAADAFVATCESLCQSAGIPLQVLRVDAAHLPGESPEDAARRARYAALSDAARHSGAGCVLLGQHADDQVETLLLALSRGAGLPGLAGMGPHFERQHILFFRPLLQVAATDLRQWLQSEGVPFVDDPSNVDERFTRNRIRARLMPALLDAFPQFRETVARSARHAAQAQRLLVEVAEQDLAGIGQPPQIKGLQGLSVERQANVLRHWLLHENATPSAAQLDELLSQVSACTTRGHQIRMKVASGYVTRSGDMLRYDNTPGGA